MNMNKLINKNIKKIIKDSLTLNESLNAQEKTFQINTDLLSEDNLNNHLSLYKGYISNFNSSNLKLDTVNKSEANATHSEFRSLKVDETFNMNGVYLHELYFSNIGDERSQIQMDTLSYMRLSRDFGTFDDWQKDFLACCNSAQNGWAITYLNTYTQSYMNCIVDGHTLNVPFGSFPVIVVDVWQHSYYRDYLGDVDTYSRAMMKQLRWNVIEDRFRKADKIINVLRGQL